MKLGIDAVKKAGGICEADMCYTGHIGSPNGEKYTLLYYLDFIDQLDVCRPTARMLFQ